MYTIREKQENANGISYDGVPVTVIVTVKDNLNGKLEATVTYEKGQKKADSILFTNKYNPDKVLVTLQGMKELTGRTLEEGTFQFRLKSISEDIPEEVQEELQNDTGKAVAENVDETVTNSRVEVFILESLPIHIRERTFIRYLKFRGIRKGTRTIPVCNW